MLLGIAVFPTDQGADPATIARLVEQRGFESLFFPEHTHIPASRRTPWPGGGKLPEEYSRTYDPFVALAAAAGATKGLLIGTGVCLAIERDPIVTAKEVASLDRLSGGRLLFGVGAGWNVEEMENHGTGPRRRFSLMRERIEAMKVIWTQAEPSYHGDHVDFDPIPVTLSGARPDPELIERGAEAGVHRFTFYVQSADADETERQLDELASKLGIE
jgi:probable F420-dependent oxidoreductase